MDAKELHQALVTVTPESMEQFIQDYPNLAKVLRAWIEDRAAHFDLSSLNHLHSLMLSLLEGAALKIQSEIRSSEVH